MNTLIQLLALNSNTDPENQYAQHYRQLERQTDGQMDDMMMPIAEHTVYIASSTIMSCD